MGKLRWRSARWRKPGGLKFDVKFRSQFESEQAKQKRTRHWVRQRDADVRGRQDAVTVRRFVVV